MNSSLLRPLRVLCCVAAGAMAASCGGGGGDAAAAPDCFYTYASALPAPQTGVDPYLTQQWHLRNVGQSGGTIGEDIGALDAWALFLTRGEGVRVAVVDDAIETVHEDLAPNVVSFFDYRPWAPPGSAPLPCEIDDDHGTAVAGIAVARDDNGVGGAGVAPRAELAAYNALATGSDADIANALLRESAVTGVYNNSWGSPDDGLLHPAESTFVDAIRTGIDTGRGGSGSIYVFPAGNGGCYLAYEDGTCAFDEDSNYDGYVNKLGVIAVCAVDDKGTRPTYAEPGANVLVCGMSGNYARPGITTTAPLSSYRDEFSGTSASTPMVTGVVALMLQENPALTWRDVRLILARTARQNDSGDLAWSTHFGLHFNPKYGFGVADADAAVSMARDWKSTGTTVGNSATLERCPPFLRGSAAPFPIAISDTPALPSVDEITVDASTCPIGRIEFVEVRFSATHAYSGDLRIELISPNGLVSRLASERICNPDGDTQYDDCGAYEDWAFGSVRHLDEPTVGKWQLRVTDVLTGDVGTWNSWQLTFWGRR